MAKESADLPLITKVTMSKGAELRRHSTGIASSGNNEKKVVPHYLRASTGSCHDFCKYGRKHVEEAREKLSMIKRAGRKSLSRRSEDIVAKQKISVDTRSTKMSTVKNSEPVDSKIQISDASDTNKMEFPTKSSGSQKQIGNKVLVNASKASLIKPSFLPKSHLFLQKRGGGISSSFEVETSSTATSERVKTHPKSTSQMVKTSPKSMFKMKQNSFEDKEIELPDKHVTSLNPDFTRVQTISSMNSSEGLGGQMKSKIKMKKKEASPKSSCREIGSVSARKHRGLKIVPHLMNQPKPIKVELEEHNNEAQEKTLYVIKMESANQTSQSDQNESQDIELPLSSSLSSPEFSSPSISQPSSQEDQEESEYANSELEEDDCPRKREVEYTANVDILEAEENGKPQNDGIVCCEDEECQKLGEEWVKTQTEKGSLGSLGFQRGKVSGDTDVQAVAIIGPEKVVLRHQDVEVKKDRQGLYNNVIEETASKLVETQKGKVKALIEAFESVISIEEKKTSAMIVN